jgi:hypothetical protein
VVYSGFFIKASLVSSIALKAKLVLCCTAVFKKMIMLKQAQMPDKQGHGRADIRRP